MERASSRCIKTRANEHIHTCNNVASFQAIHVNWGPALINVDSLNEDRNAKVEALAPCTVLVL